MSFSAEAEALTRMGLGRGTGRGSNIYMGISGAAREQSARRRGFHIFIYPYALLETTLRPGSRFEPHVQNMRERYSHGARTHFRCVLASE